MGKKGKWLSVLENVFRWPSESKELALSSANSKNGNGQVVSSVSNVQNANKVKRRWSFAGRSPHPSSVASPAKMEISSPIQATMPHYLDFETKEADAQNDSQRAMAMAAATAAAAEAAIAAAHAAAKAVCLSMKVRTNSSRHSSSSYPGLSAEEEAAIKIQTAIRGYQARQALRSLRRSARLQTLIRGQAVQKQTMLTLRSMQALVRVQARIRMRRALTARRSLKAFSQRQRRRQQMTHNRNVVGAHCDRQDWDPSSQSLADIVSRRLNKQKAALRRKRASAYAYSHQLWRHRPTLLHNVSENGDLPCSNDGEWNWLDRWLAARAWEIYRLHSDMIKSSSNNIAHTAASPLAVPSLSQPSSTLPILETCSHPRGSSNYRSAPNHQDDRVSIASSRSIASFYSIGPRISTATKIGSAAAVSSIPDYGSLPSLPAVPSYMAATQCAQAKARSRWYSSLRQRQSLQTRMDVSGPDDSYLLATKRRLSIPTSCAEKGAVSTSKQLHSGVKGA